MSSFVKIKIVKYFLQLIDFQYKFNKAFLWMEYIFWYKIICLIVGLVIVFLGYKLFQGGVFNESGDIEGNFKDYKLLIRKAAPGTYFVLFGSIIIGLIVFKGYSYEELSKKSNKQRLPQTESTQVETPSFK